MIIYILKRPPAPTTVEQMSHTKLNSKVYALNINAEPDNVIIVLSFRGHEDPTVSNFGSTLDADTCHRSDLPTCSYDPSHTTDVSLPRYVTIPCIMPSQ